jgi:hypothetical protein
MWTKTPSLTLLSAWTGDGTIEVKQNTQNKIKALFICSLLSSSGQTFLASADKLTSLDMACDKLDSTAIHVGLFTGIAAYRTLSIESQVVSPHDQWRAKF